jgi:hypothetical protein
MFSFKELFEAKDAGGHGSEKHHVTAFTRMNPPTTGHMQVISKLHAVAKEHGAEHSLVVSHSNDAKKNPLTPEQKIKHLNRYSPETKVSSSSKESPTILHHAAALHKSGVQHLHVVAGSDRHEQMHKLLHQYNGKDAGHGHYNFKSITMHSSGDRDPDSEGTEGMSGTKMRQHAHENNFKEFRKGVPSHVSDKHAHELMNDVRKGSGIKEETISYETFMEARMSAAVKLQRAFEREQQKSAASRERAKELLAPKKPEPVKEDMQFEDFDDKNLAKQDLANKKNKGGIRGNVIAALKRKAGMLESVHDNRTGFTKRKREDDEYHNGGDLNRHTYKYKVSKPGVNNGEKHERHVTTPLTSRKKHELEHLARAHLTKQGYEIHEEAMQEEQKRGPYKQKSAVVIAPKEKKAKTYGDIVSKLRPVAEESEVYAKAEENKRSADAAKKQGNMFDHHMHMADHHDNLAQWHSEKGRHSVADTHASKAEEHHEKAMGFKEEVEQIDEISQKLAGNYYGAATKKHIEKVGVKPDMYNRIEKDMGKQRKAGVDRAMDRVTGSRKTNEENETQENQMGLKSFSTLVKEGTLQSSGDDSIPTLTKAPVAPTIARKYIKGTPENKALKASSKPINGHPTGKYNEEVEVIGEALDPSEIASNPRMYSADSAKKAYYHKKASASDKESLARHLDRHHGNKEWRKPVKEETESIDEGYAKVETKKYSWGTMKTAHHGASFSVPMHPEHHKAIHDLKDQQEHKFKTEDGRHWTAKRQGDDVHLHSANDGPKTKIKHSDLKEELVGKQVKLDKNKNGKLDSDDFKKLRKEEAEQIEEANHREFASQGKMHPDMAKHMKAGHEMDFYHSKTGDKVSGVVKHVSSSEVHIKAHKDGKMGAGEVHKFKVSSTLDEAAKHVAPANKKPAVDVDKVNAAGQEPHHETFEDHKKVKKESFSAAELFQALKEGLWPGTPEHTAKFGDKYKQSQGGASGIKKGTRYGGSLQKDEPEHDDDAPKAGRPTGAKSGARKNLGNSKLHK